MLNVDVLYKLWRVSPKSPLLSIAIWLFMKYNKFEELKYNESIRFWPDGGVISPNKLKRENEDPYVEKDDVV